jgi:alkylated DNA repair protein alkB family protein 6
MRSSLMQFSPLQFRLESVRVGTISSCYYVNEWISPTEEKALLDILSLAPPSSWVQLRGRSLQCWGGTSATDPTINDPLPSYLISLLECVKSTQIFANACLPEPRHVLLNRYESGQGIMPHRDGPAYHSLVCILSIGSSATMNFYSQPPSSASLAEERDEIGRGCPLPNSPTSQCAVASILLLPRSLLIFTDELYTKYFHMIDEIHSDSVHQRLSNFDSLPQQLHGKRLQRTLRYSFTIRSAKFH